MVSLKLIALLVSALVGATNAQCQGRSNFKFQPNFASGTTGHVVYNGLKRPRHIKFDNANPPNLLVVDVGVGILALSERSNSCDGFERKVVVENADLNHGIELQGDQLFTSTAARVLLYNYDANSKSVSGSPQVIVHNMSTSDHATRTLVYQSGSPPYIIVTRGSESNIDLGAEDLSTGRSQIRRFALGSDIPSGGYEWSEGELLAWGIRNAVGIALSQDGSRLWEVENSADEIEYQGIDVHEDNPAEELNMIDLASPSNFGKFYGYPNCLTAWNMSVDGGPPGFKPGDQFSIANNASRDDSWCQSSSNVEAPRLSFQAHSAPLDIKFYSAPSSSEYAIDSSWSGNAFVSFHGSWDRTRPTGYGVIRIPWSGNEPQAAQDSGNGYSFVVQAPDLSKCNRECIRPVGIAFDGLGRMFISSDATGEIFVVEDENAPDANGGVPSSTASRLHLSICAAFAALLLTAVL